MRRSTAYKRPEGFYLHAESQTTAGVWVATKPFLKLPIDVSTEELGQAVDMALAVSQTGIAHPQDWSDVEYPLPEMAGLKSWASFMEPALCVNIADVDGLLEVNPSKNLGSKRGYEPLDEKITIRERENATTLGTALLNAFNMCK